MKMNEFAEAIQPELRAIPTPEADDALLQRILASREAGTRIILPNVTQSPRRRVPRIAFALIAAMALLVIVPIGRRTQSSTEDVIAVSPLFGMAAFAHTAGHSAPSIPPIRLTRAAAIRPMTLELSNGSVSVVGATFNNTPAWRVTARQEAIAETVYIARADLRLLRRSVHMSPYRRFQRINIQQQFIGDSISGRMTTDGPSIGAGRAIARKLPKQNGPFLSDAFTPLLLMATELSAGWKGSASLVGWAVVPNDVYMPVNMRVEGADRIKVPAGTFDCWRLSIEFGGRRIQFWARKSDGLGIRVKDGERDLMVRSIR